MTYPSFSTGLAGLLLQSARVGVIRCPGVAPLGFPCTLTLCPRTDAIGLYPLGFLRQILMSTFSICLRGS